MLCPRIQERRTLDLTRRHLRRQGSSAIIPSNIQFVSLCSRELESIDEVETVHCFNNLEHSALLYEVTAQTLERRRLQSYPSIGTLGCRLWTSTRRFCRGVLIRGDSDFSGQSERTPHTARWI